MLKKRPHIEAHKTIAAAQLAARLETLQSKGMTEREIQRDTQVRHFKGKIRQATHQLAGIAGLEAQMARKAEIKAEKLALPKMAQPKKRHPPDAAAKKVKKEKRTVVESDA